MTSASFDWIHSARARRIGGFLSHPYLLFLLVGLLVWLPEGFNIGPNSSEDWALLFKHGAQHQILDEMWTRLFRDLPIWFGMRLTPHGFQGWQTMFMVMSVLRGCLFYEIMRRIVPRNLYLAVACGLLAMFHPADSGYFWLNTTGVQFSLVLTLAACLCAVIHLETGGWVALVLTWLFQWMVGFTYSGFMLLMFAVPAGAWALQWAAGNRRSLFYLLRIGISIVVLVAVEVVAVHMGIGKDAKVADVNLHRALLGYREVSVRLFTALGDLGQDFKPVYFIVALAAGGFALWVCLWRGRGEGWQDPERRQPWRWYCLVVLGLVVLAALSYLPYSVSASRDADRRQLLGAGLFVYSALCFIAFMLAERYLRGRMVQAVLVAFIAVVITLSGLEKRSYLVERYRDVESLLGALAAVDPRPPEHSFFVINMTDMRMAKDIFGIYARPGPLTRAVNFMYGSRAVDAWFFGVGKERAQVGEGGVSLHQQSSLVNRRTAILATESIAKIKIEGQLAAWRANKGHNGRKAWRLIPYGQVILVQYPGYSPPELLDADWLKRRAPSKAVAAAIDYRMPSLRPPAPNAIMCTMLEPQFRPDYCLQPAHKR